MHVASPARKRTPAKPGMPAEDASPDPLDIRLSHGAAVWVLSELGFQGDVTRATFNEYMKSLRKLGLPFSRATGHRAFYSFDHLMELSLALSLRVYNTLPDAIVPEIIRHRAALTEAYHRAYLDRAAGEGRRLRIRRSDCTISLRGLYLDLQIVYRGGRLVSFGPPRLLDPAQALEAFAAGGGPSRAFVPIKISALAEQVVELSRRAPQRATNVRSLREP